MNEPIDFIEQEKTKKKVKRKIKWPFLSRENHKKAMSTQLLRAEERIQQMMTDYNHVLNKVRSGDEDVAAEFNGLHKDGNKFSNVEYLNSICENQSLAENIINNKSVVEAKKGKIFKISETINRFLRSMLGMFGIYAAPTDFNEVQYRAQREASVARYMYDPIAGNIVDQLLFFSLGKGIKISSSVEVVDEYIQKFLKDYKFGNNQKWDMRQIILSGEMNWFMIPDDEKKLITVERLPSMFINEVRYYRGNIVYYLVSDRYFDDDEKFKAIKDGKWYKSARFDEFDGDKLDEKHVPSDVEDGRTIYTIKYGDGKRGEPFLVRTLRWYQIHEELGKDVARLLHEQARIILKKTIYQSNLDNPTEKDIIRDAPPGGYMVVAIKGRVDYEFMSAKIDGAGIKDAIRFIRSFISAGTHMPEYIAFSDASNENYASILESKTPFIVFVEFRQDFYKEEFELFLRRNIEMAVEAKYLDDTVNSRVYRSEAAEIIEASQFIIEQIIEGKIKVKEITDTAKKMLGTDMENVGINTAEAPIHVLFPILRYDDFLKLSQSMQIHNTLGIPETIIWRKMGYDPEEIFVEALVERQKKQKETEEDMKLFNQGKSTEPPDFTKVPKGKDE